MMQKSSINKQYDVIIMGGGPVGLSLGIELGMHNINTLILEKNVQPPLIPRAQSLSARTMEFFLRWGIDQELESKVLISGDLPAIWCSKLNGETYFVERWGDNRLKPNDSPKKGIRVPLWITENVLRARIEDFSTVDLLLNHEVKDVMPEVDSILIKSMDKTTNKEVTYNGKFLACCDGSNGISKKIFQNKYQDLSPKTRVLSVKFTAKDIWEKKSVPDGMFYYVDIQVAVGPIDLKNGLWFAQIIWNDDMPDPCESIISRKLNTIFGWEFDKQIIDYHFWNMQVRLIDKVSIENRIFWLGDSAHALAPTGGLGLNTAVGDSVNLGWKLASVIKNRASSSILSTYEKERVPVWMDNLNFSKLNVDELLKVKTNYPPEKDYQGFVRANAELGKLFLSSSGLTMGYCYSNLTLNTIKPRKIIKLDPFEYTPVVEPGYFLPHILSQNKPIYTVISSINWTLLISGEQNLHNINSELLFQIFSIDKIDIVKLDVHTYPYIYLLIRPDWHIAWVGNTLENITERISAS